MQSILKVQKKVQVIVLINNKYTDRLMEGRAGVCFALTINELRLLFWGVFFYLNAQVTH